VFRAAAGDRHTPPVIREIPSGRRRVRIDWLCEAGESEYVGSCRRAARSTARRYRAVCCRPRWTLSVNGRTILDVSRANLRLNAERIPLYWPGYSRVIEHCVSMSRSYSSWPRGSRTSDDRMRTARRLTRGLLGHCLGLDQCPEAALTPAPRSTRRWISLADRGGRGANHPALLLSVTDRVVAPTANNVITAMQRALVLSCQIAPVGALQRAAAATPTADFWR